MKIVSIVILLAAIIIGFTLWLTQPETIQVPTSNPTTQSPKPTKPKPTTVTIEYIKSDKPLHVNNETQIDTINPIVSPIQSTDTNTTDHSAQTQTDNYKITFKIPKIEPNEPSRTIQLSGIVETEPFDRIIPLQIPHEGNISLIVQSIYQTEENEFNLDISTLDNVESWQVVVDMQNNSVQIQPTPTPRPTENQDGNQKETILPKLD